MNARTEWLNVDPSRRQAFERALNVSGVGSVYLQTVINKVVQQLTLRHLGVYSALDIKPGKGDKAYINQRTAGTTGGEWVADTDSGTEETGTAAQTNFPYQTLLTRGKVTRKISATGANYSDVLGDELMAKHDDFRNRYENGLVQGNSVADSNQIDGLLTLINRNSGQVVAQTSGASGGTLTLEKLDETIDLVKGSENREDLVIFASLKGRRKLNAVLQSQQAFNDVVEIDAGFRVRSYDMIPIIQSTQVPDVLTWSGTSITDFSGSTTGGIIVVNKRYLWIEELTAITAMPLARDTSQYEQFDIFTDTALVHANTLGAALLGGISMA